MSFQSIPQLFRDSASKSPQAAAYQFKRDNQWVDVSWAESEVIVENIAKGLIALDVKHQDKVCILAQTRLEWVLSDFGIVMIGAVTVGIYPSNLPEDCAYIFNHCDAEVLILEDKGQLDKILEVRDSLNHLRHIVIMDGPSDPGNGVLSWADFLAKGASVSKDDLQSRIDAISADDLASLVYTSGTTGVPKGVMLTHKNLLFTTESAGQVIYNKPEFTTLLFLPMAHVFARLIVYTCLGCPLTVAFAENITKVGDNIREIRPHFIASVPRIYEKIYDKITSGVEEAGGLKKTLFNWALGVGMQVSQLKQAKKPIPALLGIQNKIANKLVFKKIQDALGGRMIFSISGAAPLNRSIAEFFHACGVLILEGLGMTENTSFSNVNHIDNNRFGTVGQAGPGIEMKLAADGEVLYRGDNVMKGYYKNPESTAETIIDGWLYTGDIGVIDDEGFLKITDRKKDLIITAGGKNVAPQRIERKLRTSHYISQVVAYGDKRKFISALITLDPDAMEEWSKKNGGSRPMSELATDPQVHALIEAEIQERNHELASFESVKKFHILPRDLTIEEGELTPTLKIKRKVVYDKFKKELDAIYT